MTMEISRLIAGQKLIEELAKIDLVPPRTIRVIIDAEYNSTTKLYYETAGDERLLEVDWGTALEVVETKQAKDPE